MRTRQKFLSLVMAFIMIMSILPATALAEEPEDDAPAAVCTRTEGCTLADGHEGECVLPDEPEAEPTALELLQARIDALPEAENVEALMETDPDQVDGVYAEVCALVDEMEAFDEAGGLDTAKLDALVELFTPEANPLDDTLTVSGTEDAPYVVSTAEELKTAVSNGGYIKLIDDITANVVIPVGKQITLDLNGKKLTNDASNEKRDTIYVNIGASLTIVGSGTVDNVSHAHAAVFNNGTVTLRGGTYDRSAETGSNTESNGGNSWYTICNHGDMVINDGVTVTTAGGGEALSTLGRYSSLVENGYQAYSGNNERSNYVSGTNSAEPSLTINGGTFSGGLNTIKNDDGAVLTIHNGTFDNYYQASVMNHNEATINGGTYTAASDASRTTYGIYNCGCEAPNDLGTLTVTGGMFTGADFAIADISNQEPEIKISGGTFEGTSGPIGTSSGSNASISITGGTFSADVSKYVPDGYTYNKDSAGSFVVEEKTEKTDSDVAVVNGQYFTTLAAAIAAAKDGDKVTLLKDVTVGVANKSNFWINKSITLDLNQYTLTGAHQIAVGVNNPNAKVTIKNGTLVGGTSYGFLIKAGEAVLDGITITINDDAERLVQLGGGNNIKLTIKDSVIKSTGEAQYGIVNFGDKNKVIIENSEISADYWAVYHNGSYYGFEIEVTDSSLTSESAQAVYISGSTDTTAANDEKNQQASFTGCTITGTSGIEGKYTDITLKDCNITATDEPSFTQNNNGSTASGCAVVSTDNSMTPTSPAPNATIKIESGQYIGAIGLAQLIDKVEGNFEYFQEAKYIISGGDYSEPVNPEYLSEELEVELCSRARNADAPYSYYESVSEAIAAAAETGDPDAEIRLLYGDIEDARCTVTFINDGSNVKMTVNKDTVITLPALTRSGYTFLYWSDGSKTYTQGSSYTVASDVTLTAYWSRNSSSGGSGSSGYTVSVDSGKNGSVTVSPKSAKKGDTVTVTVKPDKGYELEDLTVTDKNGDELKVTRKSDTKYTFTMPAGKVTVEATFVKVEETLEHSFTDVPDGYWAEDAIAWAYENGYMNGNTAVTFNPEGTVSRQQLWMILARLSGYNPAAMAEAKSWAVDNGISDGTVPGGPVSRQQLVTILYRYAQRMGYKTDRSADLTAYPDHASVAAYAKDAMSWSVANGIVGGTTQGTLNPAGTATRAQFAVILSRFCENIAG